MENSLPALGRLTRVPPREVWPHEAHSFTPWLLNNVDVLSDLLGMELALEVRDPERSAEGALTCRFVVA